MVMMMMKKKMVNAIELFKEAVDLVGMQTQIITRLSDYSCEMVLLNEEHGPYHF